MIRVKTLLTRTDKIRHDRKKKHPVIAKINKATLAMDESGLFMLLTGRSADLLTHKTLHGSRRKVYGVLAKLYFDDDGKTIKNPRCFCHCGCDDFKFRSEVALAIRGSSVIVNSNGAFPKITNPTARPQLCKHMLAFLEKCMNYVNKNKNIKTSGISKDVKSDRELVDALRSERKSPPNLKRMFHNYFGQSRISATRM